MTNIPQGQEMHKWVRDLFPICRSLAGPGTRETLAYLFELLPDLQIQKVPSESEVFDWTVPEEWHIRDAYIADESGQPLTIEGKTHKLEEFVRIPAEMLKPAADLNKCGTIFNRKTCTFTVPRQWTSTGTVKEFTMPVSYLLDENGNYKIKHFMYNYN